MRHQAQQTPIQDGETFFSRLVGINEAAQISRASKGQISRDTKAKRLAYAVNEKGHKQYKIADLYQQYGFRESRDTSSKGPEKPQEKTAETVRIAVELAALKERVSRLEEENRDLRQTRDRLLEQNHRLTLLLPGPPTPSTEPRPQPKPEPKQRRGFLAWFRRK